MILGSIVIPAHNEASVLARTLSELDPLLRSARIELVVVANGCSDNTASIARQFAGVKVVELSEGSKVLALRAGDQAVSSFPRLYLDADIVLPAQSAVTSLKALARDDALAGRPPFVYDTTGSSRRVRAYFQTRTRLSSLNAALWGAGVYGLSAAGRARFGEFPDLVGDDLYVDSLFSSEEIEIFDCDPALVRVPRTPQALLSVLGRVYAGQKQLGDSQTTKRTVHELFRLLTREPRAIFDGIAYAGFAVSARILRRWRGIPSWAVDETSRAPLSAKSEFAVVTPSFRGDLQQFKELRRSVKRHLPDDVIHVVVVPSADLYLFADAEDEKLQVVDEKSLLPRGVWKLPGKNWHVHYRRPWWPIRGWVLQQALKLTISAQVNSEYVIVADSDCIFVRDITRLDDLRFVARPDGVTTALPRHILWHQAAQEMLGLPVDLSLPRTDYVSSVTSWRREDVVDMCNRITDVTGRPWFEVVTSQRHFSEFTLYGVFWDAFDRGSVPSCKRWVCEHWDEMPLDLESGSRLAASFEPEDVAVMISAKSGTPESVRHAVFNQVRRQLG